MRTTNPGLKSKEHKEPHIKAMQPGHKKGGKRGRKK